MYTNKCCVLPRFVLMFLKNNNNFKLVKSFFFGIDIFYQHLYLYKIKIIIFYLINDS